MDKLNKLLSIKFLTTLIGLGAVLLLADWALDKVEADATLQVYSSALQTVEKLVLVVLSFRMGSKLASTGISASQLNGGPKDKTDKVS